MMTREFDAEGAVLSGGEQQKIVVARAFAKKASVKVFDEPSSALDPIAEQKMYENMFSAAKGKSVIYISHRLDEVFDLCNNVSILRDGQHINTLPIEEVTHDSLIAMMVGREMGQEYPKEKGNIGDTILEVKNLNCGMLKDISFEVKAGEVFGISGLVGAGRTELARAILGIDKIESGEVFVKGKKVKYRKFAHAIKDGLGLIPEDRKLQGLIQAMSIKKNTSLVNLDGVIRNGFIDYALEAKGAKEYADKLTLVRPNEDVEVQFLSGGNQQKVVIAKWLFRGSDILFLDEPTRGIDVGAKYEIYCVINELAKQGKAVIIISSEMPEIIGTCDRTYVINEGEIAGELIGDEMTQEAIMAKIMAHNNKKEVGV